MRCWITSSVTFKVHRPRIGRLFFSKWPLLVWAVAVPASAQQTEDRAQQVAAELANPNTVLGSLSFNFDYSTFNGSLMGAGDQSAFVMGFQPVLPYPLGPGLNLFARPNIPIVFSQGVPTSSGFDEVGFNLGEIGFDIGVGKTFGSGLVLVGGLVGTLPTATDDRLGKDQLTLGPDLLLAKVGSWGAVGVLVTHQWNVAGGADGVETNVTGGQYFYTINLPNAWQIGSGPVWAYDHTAPDGQGWIFPLGTGIRKTVIVGNTPLRVAAEYWYYLAQPDAFGPDWRFRVVLTPVVPLPWGG